MLIEKVRSIFFFKRFSSTSISKSYNVVFFGSDRFSRHILEHLCQTWKRSSSFIEHLEVVTTESSSNSVIETAKNHRVITHLWSNIDCFLSKSDRTFDLGILASFGRLLPKRLIEHFPLGIINVHPSLLPRWRGSSPLIYTIAAGDRIAGVSIMDIRPKHFDIGPILRQESFPLASNTSMFQLLEMSASLGCSLLDEILQDLPRARSHVQEQSTSGVTYAHKLNKYSYFIDWNRQSTDEIDRLYRALNDLDNLRTSFRNEPVRLKSLVSIVEEKLVENLNRISTQPGTAIFCKSLNCVCIRCKNGWVGFKNLTFRKPMTAQDFHNGYLSKTDRLVFESVHNPLFDHIYQARVPN